MGASRRFRKHLDQKLRILPDRAYTTDPAAKPVDDQSSEVLALLRDMDWKVYVIHHDPDGPCSAPEHEQGRRHHHEPTVDFAYTVGLHDRGLPELHVPARPAGPVQPGLKTHVMAEIVNTTAARCAVGELGPGSTFDITGGNDQYRMTFRFTLGEPVDPEAVSAFLAHSDATVIPVVWEIAEKVPRLV